MIGLLSTWNLSLALMLQISLGAEVGNSPPANAILPVSVALTVIDEAGVDHPLTASDIAQLPQQTVKVTSHDKEAEFSGPSLVDVLKSCGVEFGEKLKGRRAPTVAVLDAADGYRVVISLLEIDPATTDSVAILADRRDGQPLGEKEAPYRLVIPGDKREIRWIRNLRSIHIVNLKELPLDKPSSVEDHHEVQ
jgi:Oxidoreductase molybdopterin binding domain